MASHLFEYFSQQPTVLTQWATHRITVERVPVGLVEEALAEKRMFSAIEMQNQLLYSAVDQVGGGGRVGRVVG